MKWRYSANGRTAMTLNAHKDWVTHCCFSPDGHRILSVSRDRSAKLWDSHIGIKLAKFSGHTDWLTHGDVSFDNTTFISASGDGTLKLWSMDYESWGTKICTLRGHTDWVSSCSHSPVEYRIISGSRDKTIRLWDSATKAQVLYFQGHQWEVSSTTYGPDGTTVASGSWDRLVKLWDSRGGRNPNIKTLDGHLDWVTNLSFSGDGHYLASCSSDRTVHVWDLRMGGLLTRFTGHSSAVNDVSFFSEDHFIASCSDDRTVIIWDAFSGTELLSLTGHTAPVTGVQWSTSDKRYILSSSQDKTVKLWQVDIEKRKFSEKTPFRSRFKRGDSLYNAVVVADESETEKSESEELSGGKISPVRKPTLSPKRTENTKVQDDSKSLRESDNKMTRRAKVDKKSRPKRLGASAGKYNTDKPKKAVAALDLESSLKRSRSEDRDNPYIDIIDSPKKVTFRPKDSLIGINIDTDIDTNTDIGKNKSSPATVKRKSRKPKESIPIISFETTTLPIPNIPKLQLPSDDTDIPLFSNLAKKHKRVKSVDSTERKSKKNTLSTMLKSAKGLSPRGHKGNPELRRFFKHNNLGQYENLFINAGFDGPDALQLLTVLTDKDLKEIGMKKLGHRRLLLTAIQGISSGPSLSPRSLETYSEPTAVIAAVPNAPFEFLDGVITQPNGIKLRYFWSLITLGSYDKLPVMVKYINPSFIKKFFPNFEKLEEKLPIIHEKLQSLQHSNALVYYGIVKERDTFGFVMSRPNLVFKEWLEERSSNTELSEKDKQFLIRSCIDICSVLSHSHENNWFLGQFGSNDIYLSYSFSKQSLEIQLDVYSSLGICNILASEYGCKIPKSEKKCRLNYAYCAPEVLQRRNFSPCADVWCFGVLVWELWNLGAPPYGNILDQRSTESIQSFVEFICKPNSTKLTLKNLDNPNLEIILEKVFKVKPSDRPKIGEIMEILSKLRE